MNTKFVIITEQFMTVLTTTHLSVFCLKYYVLRYS